MSNDAVLQYGEVEGRELITVKGGKLVKIERVHVDPQTRAVCSRCGRFLRFVFVGESPYVPGMIASQFNTAIVFGSTCQQKQENFAIHSVYEMVYPGETPEEVERQHLAPLNMRPRVLVK